MPIQPLGKVTIPLAGTPLSLAATLIAAGLKFRSFHAAHLQALDTNTGKVYIGAVGMVAVTRAGCIHILPAPTTGILPSFGMANVLSPAGIDISTVYLDVDVSGEGVLLTLLET